MTRGTIDLKVVHDRLALTERCLTDLRALPATSLEEFLSDRRNAAAADSLLRRAIEALFDTARHLLARGFGLGTLEYRAVARASGENGLVASDDLRDRFVLIAGFRNRLAHHYDVVTPEELFGVITGHLHDLDALAAALRDAAARLARAEDKP